jgi:hypothetical protein
MAGLGAEGVSVVPSLPPGMGMLHSVNFPVLAALIGVVSLLCCSQPLAVHPLFSILKVRLHWVLVMQAGAV